MRKLSLLTFALTLALAAGAVNAAAVPIGTLTISLEARPWLTHEGVDYYYVDIYAEVADTGTSSKTFGTFPDVFTADGGGLCLFSIDVLTPEADSTAAPLGVGDVSTDYPPAPNVAGWEAGTPAIVRDIGEDGDEDALAMAYVNIGKIQDTKQHSDVGVTGPALLATQKWQLPEGESAYLDVVPDPWCMSRDFTLTESYKIDPITGEIVCQPGTGPGTGVDCDPVMVGPEPWLRRFANIVGEGTWLGAAPAPPPPPPPPPAPGTVEVSGADPATTVTIEVGTGGGTMPGGEIILADTAVVSGFVQNPAYGFTTLAFGYDMAEVEAAGIVEDELRLYYDDGSGWVLAGGVRDLSSGPPLPDGLLGDYGVNMADDYVWANVDHGSRWAIAGVPEPGTMALLGLGALAALIRRRRS